MNRPLADVGQRNRFDLGFDRFMFSRELFRTVSQIQQQPFAQCVTPDEAVRSHELFAAGLESHNAKKVISLS